LIYTVAIRRLNPGVKDEIDPTGDLLCGIDPTKTPAFSLTGKANA